MASIRAEQKVDRIERKAVAKVAKLATQERIEQMRQRLSSEGLGIPQDDVAKLMDAGMHTLDDLRQTSLLQLGECSRHAVQIKEWSFQTIDTDDANYHALFHALSHVGLSLSCLMSPSLSLMFCLMSALRAC